MDPWNDSPRHWLSDTHIFSTILLAAARQEPARLSRSARRPLRWVAAGLAILALSPPPTACGTAKAAAPEGGRPSAASIAAPGGDEVDEGDLAAELVRQLYEDCRWTAGISSFYLRSEILLRETPEGATTRYITELGFDQRRLRDEYRSEGADTSTGVHLWDGKEGKQYIRTRDHESYELCNDTGFWGWLSLWGHHEWADIGGYSFWWRPRDTQRFLAANSLLPEDFTSVGREVFAGADCHVVESGAGLVRLYIGAADHRLRGKIKYLPAERRRTEKRPEEERFEARCQKYYEFTFGEYREVGPGRWVPWEVRKDIYDVQGERSSVAKTFQTSILEVKVDEPLPEGFFQLEMKEGVTVSDYRFDLPETLPLEYDYQAGRTEAELQALHEAERKSLAKYRRRFEGLTAKVAARVGQRPCAFPEASWLNSKPLAWKDLEGQLVVLYFWAHDCRPCIQDFEVFGSTFDAFVEAGVTIVGVHTSTTNSKDVERAIESHKLSIPLCIDASGPERKSVGAMTGWFGIDGAAGARFPYLGGKGYIRIPYAVIIGRDGSVADHGFLWDMLTKAREMAAAGGG